MPRPSKAPLPADLLRTALLLSALSLLNRTLFAALASTSSSVSCRALHSQRNRSLSAACNALYLARPSSESAVQAFLSFFSTLSVRRWPSSDVAARVRFACSSQKKLYAVRHLSGMSDERLSLSCVGLDGTPHSWSFSGFSGRSCEARCVVGGNSGPLANLRTRL